MGIELEQTLTSDWGDITVHIVREGEQLIGQLLYSDDTIVYKQAKAWDEKQNPKGQIQGLKKQLIDIAKRDEKLHRILKLRQLRQQGSAFPNDFVPSDTVAAIQARHTQESDLPANQTVKVAGRLVSKRIMGKAAFAHIQDSGKQLQVYIARDNLADAADYKQFKQLDLGDIVAVEGVLFYTQKGELSVEVSAFALLVKALNPLPDKYHGLKDIEQRYRQRYVDLIANQKVRAVFETRAKIVQEIRTFFQNREYLEVETPMMQPLAGGAAAKPFATYHNALDMDLYLRIAPELYLKRLVVGGFNRVFEINRNFRNEGLSTRHNPEFTMLEFYQAYATFEHFMDLTEELLQQLAQRVLGQHKMMWQGIEIDWAQPFQRLRLEEAVVEAFPQLKDKARDESLLRTVLQQQNVSCPDNVGFGKLQVELFELAVEETLLQPTFITHYPAETSPLARRNDTDDALTDRFELFVGGREIANGFSELNDAEDQAERFKQQAADHASGDEEAMLYDRDYINALEYGLPPTAGEGIGIDRLVMLFTDSASIRDVILFPLMKPEQKNPNPNSN